MSGRVVGGDDGRRVNPAHEQRDHRVRFDWGPTGAGMVTKS